MRIDQQLKEQLGRELRAILAGWTGGQVVARFAVRPSRVSELRHGKLTGFSIGHLLRLIGELGYDVELVLRARKPPVRTVVRPSASVVRYDRFDRRVSGRDG